MATIPPSSITSRVLVLKNRYHRNLTHFCFVDKGALNNILKFAFTGLNFIYHVKCDFLFTNTKRKNQKLLLNMKKLTIYVKHA